MASRGVQLAKNDLDSVLQKNAVFGSVLVSENKLQFHFFALCVV